MVAFIETLKDDTCTPKPAKLNAWVYTYKYDQICVQVIRHTSTTEYPTVLLSGSLFYMSIIVFSSEVLTGMHSFGQGVQSSRCISTRKQHCNHLPFTQQIIVYLYYLYNSCLMISDSGASQLRLKLRLKHQWTPSTKIHPGWMGTHCHLAPFVGRQSEQFRSYPHTTIRFHDLIAYNWL